MLIDDFKSILNQSNLTIKDNSYEDIFNLYCRNEYFAKVTNSFPTSMENVKEDVDTIPSFTCKDKKYYLSVYDDRDALVAVVDCIEDHSFQNKYGDCAVWIGLLQVDMSKQKMGLGRTITEALIDACRVNGKESIQLGVIKENERAFQFWTKLGFKVFREGNNGEFDLYLMERSVLTPQNI